MKLYFVISQHSQDEQLMKNFIEYFRCGNYYLYSKYEMGEYRVTKFSDLTDKIIPFFKEHPILGVKALDYEDRCKVAELMKENKHLSKDGIEEIRKIKAGMNTGRLLNS